MPVHIDLHCHSNVSDGILTPKQLVEHAAGRGVRAMALTDHDDTDGLIEARQEAAKHGIHFINGVEISVTWHGRTLHIVGLNINPDHPPLAEGLAKIREGRHTRAVGMAKGLEKVGIEGSLEGAYRYAEKGIISRTHFARYIIEKGLAKDMRSVFKKYLIKGKPGYFEHQWASLAEAVTWIVGSGGVAVIAHPGRYDLGRTNRLLLMGEFRSFGGTSIEVVTGSHTPDQYQEFAKMAHQFGFTSSMGSDYHGPAQGYREMGQLPYLPSGCVPVWQQWSDVAAIDLTS